MEHLSNAKSFNNKIMRMLNFDRTIIYIYIVIIKSYFGNTRSLKKVNFSSNLITLSL